MPEKYDPRLIAKTRKGSFVGKMNRQGTIAFGGIPYGKFQGRWQVVQELPPSEQVMEAFTSGPQCPQRSMPIKMQPAMPLRDIPQSEDCFTLCIASSNLKGKAPVLFDLNIGGTSFGGIRIESAEDFVDAFKDVVYVGVNVRLNIFGLLYLDDYDVSGKYRFSGNLIHHDLGMSMKWIHENIAAFGGDPDNITLTGTSGGAIATFYQCVNSSRNYWKRAICVSGHPFVFFKPVTVAEARVTTKRIFEACGAKTIDDMLQVPIDRLLDMERQFPISYTDGIVLPARVNQSICGGDPNVTVTGKEMFIGGACDELPFDHTLSPAAQREFARNSITDFLNKLSEEEAVMFARFLLPEAKDIKDAGRFIQMMTAEQADALVQEYIDAYPERDSYIALVDCRNDFLMNYPTQVICTGLCKGNTVYNYMWAWSPKESWPLRAGHGTGPDMVVRNGRTPHPPRRAEPSDEMYDMVRDIWGNFIRTGKPDFRGLKAVPWDQITRPVMLLSETAAVSLNPRCRDTGALWRVYSRTISGT